MFSKNNKKMIAERSAERTLKYGLVKLNVGLASVLLATGLTFVGSQAASADTVTTSTEAQTTEVAPGQNDAATQTENQGLTKETATESLKDAKATQDKAQGEVTEATKNVEDATTVRNDAKDVEASAQKDLDASLQAKKDIPAATDKVKEDSAALDNARDDVDKAQDTSRQNYAEANKANEQAQSDLAQATAKNAEAQGAVNNAQSDVNKASENVQSAANAERNAQTVVDQAQSEANNAQSDYNNAVSQATQTDQAAKQAQEDLSKANQAVSEAQKVADQANEKQEQAQTNANTANQNVENTNAQVQKTQGDVNDAQASVKNAENDVQTAQNHDQVVAQDQSDVQAKTDSKNKADAKVNDAQKVNNEKIEAQSNAQTAVNNAQKTVDQLSKDTSAEPVENTLATSQEWINTLKEAQNYLLTHNNTLSPELDQKLSELGSKLKYQKQYQSDPTLKNQKVEYNNDGLLSNQDEIQITKFALSLINPIREQLGMPALTITQNALKIANNVANTYNRDNWIAYTYTVDSQGNETPIMKGHDINAFENAINASNPANTGASSEAMLASEEQDVYDKNGKRTGVTHYIAPTMDDLYARIYGGAADMLFTDSNMQWGHTYTLLGMGRKNENQTNNIGVQTDRYGQIHYVLESSSQNDHSNLINVNNNDASQAYQDLLNAEDNYKKFINDHQNDDLNFSDMVSEQDYKDDKASYDTMLIQMVPGLLLTRLLLTNTTSSKQRSSHILMPSTKLKLSLIKSTLLRRLTLPRLMITKPNLPAPSRHCKTLRLSSKRLSKKPAKQVLTWLVPRLTLRPLPTN